MANNFYVVTEKKSNRTLSIRLSGDFDGSSACELINVLKNSEKTHDNVAIDTNGLRNIYNFGLNVFRPHLANGNNTRLTIELTGRFREVFQAD